MDRVGAHSAPPWIAEHAEKVIEALTPHAPFPLDYDRRSVVWVENHLERARTDPDVDAETLVPALGSFLGQCIAEHHRGAWFEVHDDWAVRIPAPDGVGSVDAFPFSKVAKQAREGLDAGESIRSMLDVIGTLVERPAASDSTRDIHGRVVLDLPTYRGMVRAALGRTFWFLRVLGAVTVILGVASLLVSPDTVSASALILLGMLIVAYDEIAARLGLARLRRRGTAGDRPWHYRVHTEGIAIHTPTSDVELRWDGIRRVRRRPAAWVLTAPEAKVPVPRGAFTSADASKIDDMLAARGY